MKEEVKKMVKLGGTGQNMSIQGVILRNGEKKDGHQGEKESGISESERKRQTTPDNMENPK